MTEPLRSRKQEAAYRALADELREGIVHKRFPGGRLPTEAELSRERGLGRQTIRRAYQELVNAGLVDRVPGRGTFVAEHAGRYLRHFGSVDDLMTLSLDTEFDLVEPLRRRVDVAVADRLRLEADMVATVLFRRRHDGVPFCLTRVHLPPTVARLIEDVPEVRTVAVHSRATVIGLLDARLDKPIAEAEQSITVSPASPEATARLRCEPGQPLLRIERTYLDTEGAPVELAQSEFLPEHYSHRVTLRRSVP
jgi:GntR family transcriptional regulator